MQNYSKTGCDGMGMCCVRKIIIGQSMEYEVEGSIPRDRPKRTWIKVVEKDCMHVH